MLDTLSSILLDRPVRAVVLSLCLLVAATAFADAPRFVDSSHDIPFAHRSLEFGGDGLGGAAWLDYDGDGHLDLFLANGRGQENALYRNNGDGTFTNTAAAAGVAGGLGSSGVVAADLDNDGDQDLVVVGDGSLSQIPAEPPPSTRLFRK